MRPDRIGDLFLLDWRTLTMLAVWMIGKVNWREYEMNAMTSPSDICPDATCNPPMTAMAT